VHARRRLATLLGDVGDRSLVEVLGEADVQWSGVEVGRPDLGPDSRSIALTLHTGPGALHLICNAWWQPLEFALPDLGADAEPWRRLLDTSLDPADGLVAYVEATPLREHLYRVGPRSVVCLAARRTGRPEPRSA
jgi:glycogen operon protein